MHPKNCMVESSEYQKLWTSIYIYIEHMMSWQWTYGSLPLWTVCCSHWKMAKFGRFWGGSDPAIHKLQGIAVRSIPTPLKNIGQLGWLNSQLIWQNKETCSKPPTSIAVGKFVSLIFSAIEPPFISGIFHCHVWEHRRVASSFGTDFRFTPKGLLHCDKEVS